MPTSVINKVQDWLSAKAKPFFWFSPWQWFSLLLLTPLLLLVPNIVELSSPPFPESLIRSEALVDFALLVTFLTLLATLTLTGFSVLRRWSRNPTPTFLDTVIVAMALAATFTSMFAQNRSSVRFLALALLAVFFAKLLTLRLKHDIPAIDTLDDNPLTDYPKQDEFHRQPFLNSILGAIEKPGRQRSRVIALTGGWGGGKTSVLRALKSNLPSYCELITIESWHYRNTGALLETLLISITKSAGKYVLFLNPSRFARQYLELLSPAVPSAKPWLDVVSKILPSADDTEHAKAELTKLIAATNKHFVVMLDDIERLEQAEIHDVLRAVRLIVTIPNITYLLAFDKTQLLTAAGLKDSPDFLDKIIDEEFEIPAVTSGDYLKYLRDHLYPSLPSGHKLLAEAEKRWPDIEVPLSVILDTPRKIKRVAIPVKRLAEDKKLEINPIDYLILETLRQRSPQVYQLVRRQRALFYQEHWGVADQLARLNWIRKQQGTIAKEKQEQRNQEFQKICKLDDPAAKLLEDLFPLRPDEKESFRLRRICHPSFYDLYFTLAFLQGTGPQVATENLIAKINDASESEKVKLIAEFLSGSDLDSVLTNYGLFRKFRKDFATKQLPSVIKAINDSATSSKFIDPEQRAKVFFSAEALIAELIAELADDQIASETLVLVIRNSADVLFAGRLTRRATLADQGYDESSFGNRKPDKQKCQAAFDDLVEQRWITPGVDIFALPQDAWLLLFSTYSKRPQAEAFILRHIKGKPTNCIIWVQALCGAFRITDEKYEFVAPSDSNAADFPLLKETFEVMTEHRDTLIRTPRDKALVAGFLNWYTQTHLAPGTASSNNP